MKQDCKKVKIETKKVKRLLTNIPTGNIIELNKLVCDKISVPQENPNGNTKSGR